MAFCNSQRQTLVLAGECNNLAETVKAVLKLAGLTVFDLVAVPPEELMPIIEEAQKHGSTALTPL